MFSDEHNNALTAKEKEERSKALKKLKSSIITHFDKNEITNKVKSYSVNWDIEKEKVVDLEAWGNMIYADIINDCTIHAQFTMDSSPKNWQEKELALLDSFVDNHTTTFCGREKLLEELKEHLLTKDSTNWGLILTGESGSGKSAVFSMINKIMHEEDLFILAHSAGISAKSRNILDLLQIWNRQMGDFLGIEHLEYKSPNSTDEPDDMKSDQEGVYQDKPKTVEIEKIEERFRELLFAVAKQTRVVMLIDALDRFDPTERAMFMTWLPTLMPENIRMLATAITGTEKKVKEYHSEIVTKSIDFFSQEEAKQMLYMLCHLQHKNIPAKVESVILHKKRDNGLYATSSPLWLSLAVNILMAMDHDDFEKMKQLEGRGDEVIVDYMESLVHHFPALPGELFLSLISKAASVFEEDFTRKIFLFVACSRDGLRESDLEKLIPKTEEENWDALMFANLRRWFANHLREEGEDLQWNLVHSILRNSLLDEMNAQTIQSIHNSIASHLLSLPADDELRISETMYHLMEAGNVEQALEYYISDLTREEITGATVVLADAISIGDRGLNWFFALMDAAKPEDDNIWSLAARVVNDLNYTLSIDGHLTVRMQILEKLLLLLKNTSVDLMNRVQNGLTLGTLYEKLGMIYRTLDKSNLALDSFHNYNNLLQELVDKNPDNENLREGLVISFQYLGYIYQIVGEHSQALKFFLEYNNLATELSENFPKNENYKNLLAISCEKIGEFFQSQDQPDMALEYFIKELSPTLELYENNPQSNNYKIGLAILSSKLGEIYEARNDVDQAYKFYLTFHQLAKEVYVSHPINDSYKENLAVSYEKLGGIHQINGQLEQAKEYFLLRNELAEELHESNPQNENYKSGLAISYQRLGIIFNELGDLMPALQNFVKFNVLSQELYENNPTIEIRIYYLAISYAKLGEVYRALNDFHSALKYFQQYHQLISELSENHPENENYQIVLAGSYASIADAFKALNKLDEARPFFEKYNRSTKVIHETYPDSEYYKDLYYDSYIDLGNTYEELDKLDEAIQCFFARIFYIKELIKNNPNNLDLFDKLGAVYYRIGMNFSTLERFNESKEHLMQALYYFDQLYRVTQQEMYKNYCNQVQNEIAQLEDKGY
jgi:tetratricopeptide (TPR) repeat protein/energy-coupling factor transporter ATP-binding protein EcfA2